MNKLLASLGVLLVICGSGVWLSWPASAPKPAARIISQIHPPPIDLFTVQQAYLLRDATQLQLSRAKRTAANTLLRQPISSR